MKRKKLHWTQTPEGKAKLAQRRDKSPVEIDIDKIQKEVAALTPKQIREELKKMRQRQLEQSRCTANAPTPPTPQQEIERLQYNMREERFQSLENLLQGIAALTRPFRRDY